MLLYLCSGCPACPFPNSSVHTCLGSWLCYSVMHQLLLQATSSTSSCKAALQEMWKRTVRESSLKSNFCAGSCCQQSMPLEKKKTLAIGLDKDVPLGADWGKKRQVRKAAASEWLCAPRKHQAEDYVPVHKKGNWENKVLKENASQLLFTIIELRESLWSAKIFSSLS